MNRTLAFNLLGSYIGRHAQARTRREITDALRDLANFAYDFANEGATEPQTARELAARSERLHRDADALIGRFEEV